MKSVLVTNTGETQRAAELAARCDLHVLFVTEQRFAGLYSNDADIAFVHSLNDPFSAVRSVATQRDLSNFTHVVSLSERAAPAAGYLRSYLGLPGPAADTMTKCTNKYAMKRCFERVGLPTARFGLAGSADQVPVVADRLGWPVIIKPVIGAGVDATFVVTDRDQLESEAVQSQLRLLASPRTTSEKQFPVVVEQYLPVVDELHCDGYVRDGTIEFVRVSRYLRPVLAYPNGVFGSYLLPNSDALADEVRRMHDLAVRAVGLTDGVTHFEALETENGLFAGEIACRPGGGGIRRMLQIASGFDIWDAHVAMSLGEPYGPGSPSISANETMLQLMLPTGRGTIRAISDEQEFAHIPGLVEAKINYRPGDTVDGLMDSSSVSGYVFVRLLASEGPGETVRAVEEAFRLEVA